MWFGEPHPFPKRSSPNRLSTSGQMKYKGWSCKLWSQDGIGSTVTMLWTGYIRVQFLAGAKTSLISKKHRLVLGRTGTPPEVMWPGMCLTTYHHLAPRFKNEWSYNSTPSTRLHAMYSNKLSFACIFYLMALTSKWYTPASGLCWWC